ncbi:MAG: T9SS type A sorting domain-containing protein, partial [Bacteroidales bacterium]|nr:T9SS type A sorting domain-containing protein [Bacteroidales bacterium]
TWHGTTYTTSGTYTHNYTNAQGCPSTDTLHLTIHPKALTDLTDTICSSDLPYHWHSHALTQSGSCTDTLATVHGCDSIVTLHLTVFYADTFYLKDSICENEFPISWNGAYFDSAGTQTVTYTTNYYGCEEMVLVMTLSLIPIKETFDSLYLTVSELPYYVESLHTYITEVISDTTYTFYRLDSHDCDSIIHLFVSIVDVGVESFEKQDMIVYPNPASEIIHVKYKDIDRIQIFSITGQLLHTIPCEGEEIYTIPLSNMADGSYLICVKSKEGRQARKIINIIK